MGYINPFKLKLYGKATVGVGFIGTAEGQFGECTLGGAVRE